MITFDDFLKVDIRVGRIIEVEASPEARKTCLKLKIDFGSDIGVKKPLPKSPICMTQKACLDGKYWQWLISRPARLALYV